MVFDAFRRTLGGPSSPAMEVLQGRDRVISFPGTSQFRVQGVSACGLAALNFARIAFRIVKDHSNILDILDMIASRETVEVSTNPVANLRHPSSWLIPCLGGYLYLCRVVK